MSDSSEGLLQFIWLIHFELDELFRHFACQYVPLGMIFFFSKWDLISYHFVGEANNSCCIILEEKIIVNINEANYIG